MQQQSARAYVAKKVPGLRYISGLPPMTLNGKIERMRTPNNMLRKQPVDPDFPLF